MKNKSIVFMSSIIFIIVILDQITKRLILKYLSLHQSIPLINNILHFTHIQNTGAGFGILKQQNTFLIFTSLIIIGVILYNFDKTINEKPIHIPIALILGGALGNLVDRIFLGHVIDFIDFRIWPSFNIADSAIMIGALWLMFYFWKK